jgi:threonine/homoserine/homoserine lactone efflux protein
MHHINLVLFCLIAIPLIFTPGPDIIYIVTRGITQGRLSAVLSMFGVCAGYVVHTLLAVFGLSALLHTSEFLFNFIRYAGAAYLVYLGVHALVNKQHFEIAHTSTPVAYHRQFLTGMATSLLNPKAILFFFSFRYPLHPVITMQPASRN